MATLCSGAWRARLIGAMETLFDLAAPPALDVPAAPPPAVLAEVDAAWERALRLQAAGWDLSVCVGRIGGRARVRLRRDGVEVAALSASRWLALACGDAPLPVAR